MVIEEVVYHFINSLHTKKSYHTFSVGVIKYIASSNGSGSRLLAMSSTTVKKKTLIN